MGKMTLHIVQLGSPRSPAEGLRIGTVRRPPRGVPKSRYSSDNWYDVWLPELSIVAVEERSGLLVGHVVTSRAMLHGEAGLVRPILGLGPISVAPERQGQGIGGTLIRATIARASASAWPVIVLLGHADYYPRFGFEPARDLGIEPPRPWSDEHWMALRLPAWTPDLRGTMRYPSAFGID